MSTQRTLLHIAHVGEVSVIFWQNVGIHEVSKITHMFPVAEWREMGAPSEITLTMEAGDKLNGSAA